MSSDIDTAELASLLTQAVGSLTLRGRGDDAGSLLKVGRFEARLRAIDALPAGEARRALAAELHLDLVAAFPATLSHSFSHADEDLHLSFEKIGRRCLAGEALA
ncbi:MAG: hypothetical protein EOP62_04765 [Sphingomonadales bacterium]|nr:MAG: hypothetical protein EOP62_04765 [Sphingomonadales bacterium]